MLLIPTKRHNKDVQVAAGERDGSRSGQHVKDPIESEMAAEDLEAFGELTNPNPTATGSTGATNTEAAIPTESEKLQIRIEQLKANCRGEIEKTQKMLMTTKLIKTRCEANNGSHYYDALTKDCTKLVSLAKKLVSIGIILS